MDPIANVNGQQMPLADVRISPLDRGFLFGDAVYEVIRVYGGKPFHFDEHLDRLRRSLEAIRITSVDLERLRRRVVDTIAAGPFAEATVYIQITRGAAPRRHAFPQDTMPMEFLYVQEFQDPYVTGRKEGVSVITTPDIRWDRCDIKSTNLLANVLAMQSAKEAGGVEAIFFLPDGTITEGTHTSFFGVLGGKLLTAPQSSAILPGITRGLILRIAREQQVPIQEHTLRLQDLPRVSELFLTGTTSEVLPVVKVDQCVIGSGKPGPITGRLQEGYRKVVAGGR
jgi:D-alanine transaminase